jgi:6-pyruvoyltetrahydropterin/6-carboxytetrahydropterin synthase
VAPRCRSFPLFDQENQVAARFQTAAARRTPPGPGVFLFIICPFMVYCRLLNQYGGFMYRLTIHTAFAAAHNLIHYQGDCENLHGHNWKVEVSVTTEELDKAGLGIDFKILKKETNALLKTLDHKYLNELPPFAEISPSSEHIARYLYGELTRIFADKVQVEMVTVWESDFASASYYE